MTTDLQPQPPTTPTPFAFRFLVQPGESDLLRENRWNRAIAEQAKRGYAILGTGPDLDWPVKYEPADPEHPEGAFYEMYHLTPLGHDWLAEAEVL